MARDTGPKNRLARREGTDLELKTPGTKTHASLLRRLNIPPGQHGPKGSRRKPSDYSFQLREKQKAKRYYGVLEKQFKKYYTRAIKVKGNTGETLLIELETRLDNVVYRACLAPTRNAARQMITHGHVMLNNEKVSIPSYQIKENDVISLKPKGLNIPSVKKILEEKNPVLPTWIERKGAVGRVIKLPVRSDIKLDIDEHLIVEYYSR